jgi:hypothetical protein
VKNKVTGRNNMVKTAGVENLLNEVLQRITLIRINMYSRWVIFKK